MYNYKTQLMCSVHHYFAYCWPRCADFYIIYHHVKVNLNIIQLEKCSMFVSVRGAFVSLLMIHVVHLQGNKNNYNY